MILGRDSMTQAMERSVLSDPIHNPVQKSCRLRTSSPSPSATPSDDNSIRPETTDFCWFFPGVSRDLTRGTRAPSATRFPVFGLLNSR
ncbi:unnamed protein product [Cuscuta campestris]|uniref:Uncharacterized protein n=1 Tax=Cuscuta campestris TaxID=132261 RepID=A0A484MCR7_9ASTE|nr:unnamed protein product [Cuscuta campestris]